MYNYYKEQIQPIINIQRKNNDKYKATIKIVSGYGINKSNCIDVSIEQLEKIIDILQNN